MLPKSPVPADWSIFDVTIKTVMQTMAAKTKKAFGGLVMFTTPQCQRPKVQLSKQMTL